MYLYLFSDCTSKIPFKNFVMEISVLSVLSVFKYIASIILKYYWCTFMFTGPIKLWNRKMALKQLYVYFMLLCKVNSWTSNCVSCRLPIPGPTVLYLRIWQISRLDIFSIPGSSAIFQWLAGTPDSIRAFSSSLQYGTWYEMIIQTKNFTKNVEGWKILFFTFKIYSRIFR